MEFSQLTINLLAQSLFNECVALPTTPAVGQGVKDATGRMVEFSTAVMNCHVLNITECVRFLAEAVKAEGKRVGAVSLRELTPLCIIPLPNGSVDVFWDGLYELPDGMVHSPMPFDQPAATPNGVWHQDKHAMVTKFSPEMTEGSTTNAGA